MSCSKSVFAIALLSSAMVSSTEAHASVSSLGQSRLTTTSPSGFIKLAHAQDYRHCHNIHTRVDCHKRDRLPMNWPPLSETPSSNTLRLVL